jgi:hypothetical protein
MAKRSLKMKGTGDHPLYMMFGIRLQLDVREGEGWPRRCGSQRGSPVEDGVSAAHGDRGSAEGNVAHSNWEGQLKAWWANGGRHGSQQWLQLLVLDRGQDDRGGREREAGNNVELGRRWCMVRMSALW